MSAAPVPAGEYLRDELRERGITQAAFAASIGRPAQVISQIICGKKSITPESALQIGDALGTSAEVWLSLQMADHLHRARVARGDS